MICMSDQVMQTAFHPQAKDRRMGVVGERDAVMAFRAVGMRVIAVSNPDETAKALHRLSTEGVSVIFITETCAQEAQEAVDKYKTMPGTAVIPIPGSQGANGFGIGRVKANVEKAIGANILFDQEKEGT